MQPASSEYGVTRTYVETLVDIPWNEQTEQAVKEVGLTPHPVILAEVAHHQKTTPSDGDVYARSAERWANKIKEVTPLEEVDNLAQKALSDVEQVNSKGAKGVDCARPVLEKLWEYRMGKSEQSEDDENVGVVGTNSSQSLGEEIGVHKDPVTTIMNRLSLERPKDTWTSESLVVDLEDGERGRSWEFTHYGELIANTAFTRDNSVEWIYRYAIGPEELTLRERRIITFQSR